MKPSALFKRRRGPGVVHGKATVTLGGREIPLAFDFAAACELDRATGLNVFEPETFGNTLRPSVVRDGVAIAARCAGGNLTEDQVSSWCDADPESIMRAAVALKSVVVDYVKAVDRAARARGI